MSRKRHVPLRMCVGCRERKAKNELLRFTRDPEGRVILCEEKPFVGRGFYLCPHVKCFVRAKKKNHMTEILSAKDRSPVALQGRLSSN